MENFFLQSEATNGISDSISGGLSGFVESINPFQRFQAL
jgi:hypothetical protein